MPEQSIFFVQIIVVMGTEQNTYQIISLLIVFDLLDFEYYAVQDIKFLILKKNICVNSMKIILIVRARYQV